MWKKDSNENVGDVPQMANPISDAGSKPVDTKSQPKETKVPSNAQIGEKVVFDGKITGNSDVLIAGKFTGSISVPNNTIVVERTGNIEANITAAKVIVKGFVQGDIQGETVHIVTKGTVDGNIKAVNVVLENECDFNGSIEMDKDKTAAVPPATAKKPEASVAAPQTMQSQQQKTSTPSAELGTAN